MPLGGEEQTSGYKGYGLSAVVELFCGIASGKRNTISSLPIKLYLMHQFMS